MLSRYCNFQATFQLSYETDGNQTPPTTLSLSYLPVTKNKFNHDAIWHSVCQKKYHSIPNIKIESQVIQK